MYHLIVALILSICRSIASRRFFFLIGTLYLYRCVTMYITTLPVPGMHMTCAPKVSGMKTSERRISCRCSAMYSQAPSGTHFAQPRKRGSYKKAISTFYCLRTPTILRCISVWSKACAPGSCLLGCVVQKDQRSDGLIVVLFPRFWKVLDRELLVSSELSSANWATSTGARDLIMCNSSWFLTTHFPAL